MILHGVTPEKAEEAERHPHTETTINPAEDNRKKQCKPDETKPISSAIHTETQLSCT